MPEPLRYDDGHRWDTDGLTWDGFAPETTNTNTNTKTMLQNLIELAIPDADWTDIDAAILALETKLAAKLVDLTEAQRGSLNKMGEKGEPFCRESLVIGRQKSEELTTRAVAGLTKAEGDLSNFDKLRPRLVRLQSIVEKADDSQMALGSDVMVYSTFQYGLLSAIGAGAGLDELYDQLSVRFAKNPAPAPVTPPPPTP